MLKIDYIWEDDDIIKYLVKRNLFKQYNKNKGFILAGKFELVNLKLMQPKQDKIYSFRINKQFRVKAKLYKEGDKNHMYIIEIDNHQGY